MHTQACLLRTAAACAACASSLWTWPRRCPAQLQPRIAHLQQLCVPVHPLQLSTRQAMRGHMMPLMRGPLGAV